MPKQNHLAWTKISKKPTLHEHSMRSFHEVLERDLLESLNRIEHRAEILIAISDSQRKCGRDELAEAYRKQGMNSRVKVQSIRKLFLEGRTVGEER